MSFKKMKIKAYLLIFSCILISSSCKKKYTELDNYEIISAVLNSELGKETDLENGSYWIDESKEYNSLLFLNHTYLNEFDLQMIQSRLNNEYYPEFHEFDIDDFKKGREWNIKNIKNYNRFKLVVKTDQPIKSPFIGLFQISSISYNQTSDKAIVFCSFLCAGSGDCGGSMIYYLTRKLKWEVEKVETLEVY
tara:strand:- start:73 stop:648 length:576 start_codon:yes stop_codon:yes gene_type:complete